jgi:hypothetical protein
MEVKQFSQVTAIDPSCKMKVEEKGAKYTSMFNGKTILLLQPDVQEEV